MIKTLSMVDLYEKSKTLSADELIVDVRTAEEYAEGHVPKSRNISHEMVAEHADELKKYKKFYMYCRSGGRVSFAAHTLLQLGLTNFEVVVDGGMPDWSGLGYPEEK